jgi:GNAT superfamily N-acetyltransferase
VEIAFRPAARADLEAIVALLADDDLGAGREDASLPLDARYTDAFDVMAADPNQLLVVAAQAGAIVGEMQLTFIPGLSRLGMTRGLIESVRIAARARSGGLGAKMFEWGIAECRRRGCGLVQLTTDKTRPDAHRFYERLGFVASHEGYKLSL